MRPLADCQQILFHINFMFKMVSKFPLSKQKNMLFNQMRPKTCFYQDPVFLNILQDYRI